MHKSVNSRVVWLFGAEWRPPDHALEHDGAERPPITAEGVSLSTKDFRCDVVWCPDRRVCHPSAGLAPRVNLATVAHGEIDLVERNRVAVVVVGLAGHPSEKLLVVGCFMFLVESGGQTEVRKFDVPFGIHQNVVRFDIPASNVSRFSILVYLVAKLNGFFFKNKEKGPLSDQSRLDAPCFMCDAPSRPPEMFLTSPPGPRQGGDQK